MQSLSLKSQQSGLADRISRQCIMIMIQEQMIREQSDRTFVYCSLKKELIRWDPGCKTERLRCQLSPLDPSRLTLQTPPLCFLPREAGCLCCMNTCSPSLWLWSGQVSGSRGRGRARRKIGEKERVKLEGLTTGCHQQGICAPQLMVPAPCKVTLSS